MPFERQRRERTPFSFAVRCPSTQPPVDVVAPLLAPSHFRFSHASRSSARAAFCALRWHLGIFLAKAAFFPAPFFFVPSEAGAFLHANYFARFLLLHSRRVLFTARPQSPGARRCAGTAGMPALRRSKRPASLAARAVGTRRRVTVLDPQRNGTTSANVFATEVALRLQKAAILEEAPSTLTQNKNKKEGRNVRCAAARRWEEWKHEETKGRKSEWAERGKQARGHTWSGGSLLGKRWELRGSGSIVEMGVRIVFYAPFSRSLLLGRLRACSRAGFEASLHSSVRVVIEPRPSRRRTRTS